MDFTDKSIVHPVVHLKRTMVVWITLLIFTKMNNLFSGITLLLLILSYIVNNYIDYYNQDKNKNKDLLNKLGKIDYMLGRLTILSLITGFSTYLLKQIHDHKNFSFTKFIFGVKKCGIKN